MFYLGVDPGADGAAVCITESREVRSVLRFKSATEKDVLYWIDEQVSGDIAVAVIEKLGPWSKRGSNGNFHLGGSYKALRMALHSFCIPFEAVPPGTWQATFGLISRGKRLTDSEKKRRNRAKAQELFPRHRWTHADADAVLLAEFCRRNNKGDHNDNGQVRRAGF